MATSGESIYVCIKQFNARLGDELSLKVGERIEILADDSEYNDGWYMGRNTVTHEVGLFPKSFTKVEPHAEHQTHTLLRSRSRRILTGSSVASGSSGKSLAQPAKSTVNESLTTISEIDKALEELQVGSSLDPSKSHARQTSNALALSQDLNPLKASSWTPKQVSSYFAIVLGFDMDIAGKFARHKITGAILFELDLPHLKELEIDSFGTRFEIYREIEKLKEISSRATSSSSHQGAAQKSLSQLATPKQPLMSSPAYNNSDDFDSTNLEDSPEDNSFRPTKLKTSKLPQTLLPSVDLKSPPPETKPKLDLRSTTGSSRDPYKFHLRQKSQSMENIASPKQYHEILDSPNQTTFLSPRKAPQPPAESPMNTTFKFGGSPATPQHKIPASPNPYAVREKPGSAQLRPASSVYDIPLSGHHRRASSGVGSHRRHSSVFLFLSGNNDDSHLTTEKYQSQNIYRSPKATNRDEKVITDKRASKYFQDGDLTIIGDDGDIEDGSLSPKKGRDTRTDELKPPQGRLKTLRSVSTQNFKNLTGLKKLKTSAFTEGIRDINPDDAIKSSNYSGWMAKKSGSTLGWRSRYFTLHGTRLSYFTSLRDKREKGLIDITAHKVLPISTDADGNTSNDKYIALYASLTGFGRYCFKLVPPAPGFKKGLTFTQPKTHYFAVETQEEMRGWLKALMTATIDIDDSVPVVSSCNTPTVTLAKAQEMLAKAREDTKLKDEMLRSKGYRNGEYGDDRSMTFLNESGTSEEPSPVVGSLEETTVSSTNGETSSKVPHLTVDTLAKSYRSPSTPQAPNSGGFASPYLLASGLLSPKPNTPGSNSGTPGTSTPQTSRVRSDYFGNTEDASSYKPSASLGEFDTQSVGTPGSTSSKQSSKKKGEKMMAYTSDGSFVIKSKK